jgi:hypothetical protein
MRTNREIPPSELQRYAPELSETVEAVCSSPAFRNSPKSCEFLRHIVERTLSGNIAELKERLIGMTLLGRDASYDTGSDAGVRVRANDVRKRLMTHNTAPQTGTSFTLELPAGSYVPRFFRSSAPASEASHDEKVQTLTSIDTELIPPLSLQRLAAPTLVALFLCTICLRWQIAQEHPFISFWQGVFENHRVVLYLPASEIKGGQELVGVQEIEAAAPLFNLAGQFHAPLNLTPALIPLTATGEVLVSIGSASGNMFGPTANSIGPGYPFSTGADRSASETAQASGKIFDHDRLNAHLPVSGRAAWLTVANGAQRTINIDGTDTAAISTLVKRLCHRNSFPQGLADSLKSGTVTQIIFLMSPHAEVQIFHELLPAAETEKARIP